MGEVRSCKQAIFSPPEFTPLRGENHSFLENEFLLSHQLDWADDPIPSDIWNDDSLCSGVNCGLHRIGGVFVIESPPSDVRARPVSLEDFLNRLWVLQVGGVFQGKTGLEDSYQCGEEREPKESHSTMVFHEDPPLREYREVCALVQQKADPPGSVQFDGPDDFPTWRIAPIRFFPQLCSQSDPEDENPRSAALLSTRGISAKDKFDGG